MSTSERRRKPWIPSIVVITGLLVGLVGLAMIVLGVGGVQPTDIKIPGIDLSVQTVSIGVVVMVAGFAMAVVPLSLAIIVDRQNRGQRGRPYVEEVFREGERFPTTPTGPE